MRINTLARAATLAAALMALAAAPSASYGQGAVSRFDTLRNRWTVTPEGSPEEASLEASIVALVDSIFPPEAFDAYRRYLDAPVESAEEAAALEEARQAAAGSGIPWEQAQAMLAAGVIFSQTDAPTPAQAASRAGGLVVGMVNNKSNAQSVALDVTLRATRESATAGGSFGVFGIISNRSDRPVWITDVSTKLLPPPEIWGGTPGGSVGAFFPTGQTGPRETVRIDPRGTYPVIWRLDPRSGFRDDSDRQSWRNFLQFEPGTYRFYAIVHVWPQNGDGTPPDVTNPSDSQIVVGEAAISIGLPISILIIGSALGGMIAVLLRVLTRILRAEPPPISWRRYLLASLALGVLIAVAGTILISRMGSMSGFVSLTINDIWGAIATGVVLQWIGLRGLVDRAVEEENGNGDHGQAPEGAAPAAGTAAAPAAEGA